MSWKTSALRNWLNGEFLKTAFTATEQRAICEWKLNTRQSSRSNYMDETADRVFVLSTDEVDSLLNSEELRQAALASSAVGSGVMQDAEGHAWWWLRTPARADGQAEAVSTSGGISARDAYTPYACVRPAIWVDLFDDQF